MCVWHVKHNGLRLGPDACACACARVHHLRVRGAYARSVGTCTRHTAHGTWSGVDSTRLCALRTRHIARTTRRRPHGTADADWSDAPPPPARHGGFPATHDEDNVHTCHRPPRTSAADLGRSIADASPAGSRALADSDTGVPYCLVSTPAPRPARPARRARAARARALPPPRRSGRAYIARATTQAGSAGSTACSWLGLGAVRAAAACLARCRQLRRAHAAHARARVALRGLPATPRDG